MQLSDWMAYAEKQCIMRERQFLFIVIRFRSSTAFAAYINSEKKTKWQPFEVTECTSSFISYWPHQQDPLYRDLNLGDLKMTDWFTNTVWQGGLASLSSVPWETPVSLHSSGQCFTPFLSLLRLPVAADIVWYFLNSKHNLLCDNTG